MYSEQTKIVVLNFLLWWGTQEHPAEWPACPQCAPIPIWANETCIQLFYNSQQGEFVLQQFHFQDKK